MKIASVCVFCGSSPGRRSEYTEAARHLGRTLATCGKRLIYGGGNVGLMGVIADAALEHGGEVIGVIPRHLVEREVAHSGLSYLRVVDSMHQRKQSMADLSDAFIVLPGGLGTMEEFFEIWTWGQLGFHRKPIGLLDVDGYWQPMIAMLERMVSEGFVHPEHRKIVCIDTEVPGLLTQLQAWQPVEQPRVLRPGDL